MTQRNDGGPAFPAEVEERYYCMGNQVRKVSKPGMSLRDYFAAKAMQGDIAASAEKRPNPTDCAAWAYQMADAMLAARERT